MTDKPLEYTLELSTNRKSEVLIRDEEGNFSQMSMNGFLYDNIFNDFYPYHRDNFICTKWKFEIKITEINND